MNGLKYAHNHTNTMQARTKEGRRTSLQNFAARLPHMIVGLACLAAVAYLAKSSTGASWAVAAPLTCLACAACAFAMFFFGNVGFGEKSGWQGRQKGRE